MPADFPIRLDSNENAYGPTSRVKQAIGEAIAQAHRYPGKVRLEFLGQVAKLHGVSVDQVLIGCGSVEILQAAAHAFTGPSRTLVMPSPTFEVIGDVAEKAGAQVVRVPLAKDFAHDLPAMRTKISDGTGLVYICNPNNPTASLTPRRDLDELISKLPPQAYLIVDEAYHHFAADSRDFASFLSRPAGNERVIVVRTFSKVHGLAGMRLGYAIASPGTIERIRPWLGFGNANIAILRGAMVALKDEEAMRFSVRRNAADRAQFMKQAQLRKLSPIPSSANFAMIDVGRPVAEVIEHFKTRDILVGRPFPPLNNHLRVSFGRPEEMKAFWRAWDQLPALTG
jgi:histidinol-phosphate aminotransferase